ncbi:MAG: hypothetical protein NWQ55_00955 [Salibacteraceae bacterium]|jgi:hypothetical protein|nr:hypothetical protein [Salibacteraceae bacterium]MDP4687176.1 hypothetical protein [Salibacteraceae bacterium]MDP4763793.1 hypothetical protein [Salibacteraceae bacterium]MDP4845246.1 hypothetical protein [Salibacteraceae bacterium]MDP4934359.1 hypothetical protein [Salibacteraceae bacterium]
MKNFDDIIKEKLASQEFAFNENAWLRLEKELHAPKSEPSNSFNTSLFAGVAVSSIFAIALSISSLPLSKEKVNDGYQVSQKEINVNESSKKETSTKAIFTPQEEHEIELLVVQQNTGSNKTISEKSTSSKLTTDSEKNVSNAGNTAVSNKNDLSLDESHITIDFVASGIQCEGKAIKFQANESITKGEVEWIIDDLYVLNGKKAEYKFEIPGEHKAQMIYTNSKGEKKEVVKLISIYSNPKIDLNITAESDLSCFNRAVSFSALPSSNAYKWQINGESAGSNAEFERRLKAGWYNIEITSVNEFRCSHTEKVSYEVGEGLSIFTPTGFTPNRADGTNDTWFPVNLDKMASFSVKVIRLVNSEVAFETQELKPWDGTIMNSNERARSGELFVAQIMATDECGKTQKFQQQITIF